MEMQVKEMKRKYYLRGIGVGILFATIVLFTAYSVSGGNKMTDQEVMERAEELGMVKAESVLDNLQKPADTDTEQQNITESDGTDISTEATEDSSTDTQEASTDAPDTEEPTTEEPATEGRTVTFTVVSGMNSWNVATILQDQGVIADAADFDSYLEANGYSASIATGEYSVTVGSDYETIAKLITGR